MCVGHSTLLCLSFRYRISVALQDHRISAAVKMIEIDTVRLHSQLVRTITLSYVSRATVHPSTKYGICFEPVSTHLDVWLTCSRISCVCNGLNVFTFRNLIGTSSDFKRIGKCSDATQAMYCASLVFSHC